jgi:hypothetical protein
MNKKQELGALSVQQVDTESLIPYARNAKKHPPAQVASIASSIKEFGFNAPVLIDGANGIIAGHGRVLAAQKLGMERVPCIRIEHLSENQKRAYILADNRLSELGGGWDEEMLKLEIDELASLDVNVEQIGFDQDSIKELISAEKKEIYTSKIDAPVYKPTGEKPVISTLLDSKKAEDFLSKIDASDCTDDIKVFLKKAASRHIVFNYGLIAEFYCHAEKKVQHLMEEMALVIIDYNQALELGYIKLKKDLHDSLSEEPESQIDEDENV